LIDKKIESDNIEWVSLPSSEKNWSMGIKNKDLSFSILSEAKSSCLKIFVGPAPGTCKLDQ